MEGLHLYCSFGLRLSLVLKFSTEYADYNIRVEGSGFQARVALGKKVKRKGSMLHLMLDERL